MAENIKKMFGFVCGAAALGTTHHHPGPASIIRPLLDLAERPSF